MAVTAISLSDEQLAWARERQSSAIDFRKVQDYRDVTGQFDAVVSVEMVEAVGREYWDDWFDCIARSLARRARGDPVHLDGRRPVSGLCPFADFIQTHVSSGRNAGERGAVPAPGRRARAELGDREGFALDYAETLRLWREAFDRVVAEGRLPTSFDDRFTRLWRFYLMYCEGGFRGGGIDVAQVTLVRR